MRNAIELSQYLGQEYQPTAEQARVIEADLTPALIVAGAGSGKTTTMADRVVWLVSEKGIRPDQILGLTFTRKATQELALRIHSQLKKLREVQGAADARASKYGDPGHESAGAFHESADAYLAPTISTYNSFANAIFRDNALLVGREPESTLLEESAAWALARKVILEHGGEHLAGLDMSLGSMIETVLNLSRDIAQNRVDIDALKTYYESFHSLTALPGDLQKKRYLNHTYKELADLANDLGISAPFLALVRLFNEEKRRRNLVEYSDQVALAYDVVTKGENNPVRQLLREQYKVVLLDEYQDTSIAESRLLSTIFNDHPVMAVGDPHQSIYGWRGASASNLAEFRNDFGALPQTPDYTLTISWRNDTTILDAANIVSKPLIEGSRVPVKLLKARPNAGTGTVEIDYCNTDQEEAELVADWFAEKLQHSPESKSFAILFRKHNAMNVFAQALKTRGLPHEIVGLGGLMQTPEVTDVISTLKVLQDPHSGSALIRLLTSGRWRIGVKDLKALKQLAAKLNTLGPDLKELPKELQELHFDTASPDSGYTIVDALDFIDTQKSTSRFLTGFTVSGLDQLRNAAAAFATLRRLQSIIGIPELLQQISEMLLLDIELNANETRIGTGNLANFRNAVQGFLASTDENSVQALLDWLEHAGDDNRLKQQETQSAPGRIQLLTVHAAKGLEWDYVAIPKLVTGEFPDKVKNVSGWLGKGKLPYDFRGDKNDLPELHWQNQPDQKTILNEIAVFKEEHRTLHFTEERRLAYVAITRARTGVMLTGSRWNAEKKTPSVPGDYLNEIAENFLDGGIEPLVANLPEQENQNPNISTQQAMRWPLDPLGARRNAVETAAETYRQLSLQPTVLPKDQQQRLDQLLAELHNRQNRQTVRPELPNRVPASAFKDFISNPDQQLTKFARPMPEKPFRATRLGTQFHSHVEEQAIRKGSQELFDSSWFELDLETDVETDPAIEKDSGRETDSAYDTDSGRETDSGRKTDSAYETSAERNIDNVNAQLNAPIARVQPTLETLIANLDDSEWGGIQPISVEEEIQLPLAGKIVICKIDAVYNAPEGSDFKVQVVDWKTGRAPKTAAEKADRLLQIHLYRLAYAELHNIPIEKVDAVLYYVAENIILRADTIVNRAELETLWHKAWQKN